MGISQNGTGGIDIAFGASKTITSASLNATTNATFNIPTGPQYLYTVMTPPAGGYLTKSGAPITQFTQQDINDGLIVFHQTDPTLGTDTFRYMLEATVTPGVATPYATKFDHNTVGVYWGGMLVGIDRPPLPPSQGIFDGQYGGVGGGTGTGGSGTSISGSVSFPGGPNKVVVFSVISNASGTVVSTPTSVTFPGLTFTPLGSVSTPYTLPGGYQGAMGLWMYWAPLPSVMTGTLAATFSVTAEFLGANYAVFSGVANPASPWGGTPQTMVALTFPATLTLTPAQADTLTTPLYYELNFEVMGGGYYNEAPLGYDIWFQSGQGPYPSGGTNYEIDHDFYVRSAFVGTFWIYASSPQTVTDAELYFQPTGTFVDFTDVTNRRRFVGDNGGAQYLGHSGELPFGTAPAIYLTAQPGNADAFATNNGTGGSFTIFNGDLTLADFGPACTDRILRQILPGVENPLVLLSVSDDGGRTWATLKKPRGMGKIGQYLTRLRWLKMGHARQRLVRLEISDPVRRNIVGIYVDLEEGMG